jgi:flagellar basal-body rod modification protein FlgD
MIGSLENVSSYETHEAMAAAPDASSEMGQESFLKLLVAQMQHQDPLNPQGNEEFIAQLAQFTSLEQLMGVNSSLGDLYAATTSMNNASMTQLLGRNVTAFSDVVPYDGEGSQELHWKAPAEAGHMSITVTDEDGKMVAREELEGVAAGDGSWMWDGKDIHGVQVPEGKYTISITAFDMNGNPLDVGSVIKGTINEMSYETGAPIPFIDGVEVTMGSILRVDTGTGTLGASDDLDSSSSGEDDSASQQGNP